MKYETPGFKEAVDAAEAAIKSHNAFGEGLRAAYGAPNPHKPGTSEYEEWKRGYYSSKEAA